VVEAENKWKAAEAERIAAEKRRKEEEEKKKKAAEEAERVKKSNALELFRAITNKVVMKNVVRTIIEFKKQYSPLLSPVLGKRKSSMALQEIQINAERYFDIILQNVASLDQQRRISQIFHDI
jgi:hypothetical protein